ncbi:hypothetical protein D3C83_56260 [compost metagenome]
MNLGRRPKVQLSEGFGFRDPLTMSGVDRRVSIRTMSAISPTRASDTADNVRWTDQRDFGGAIFSARKREARVVGLIPSSSAAPPAP